MIQTIANLWLETIVIGIICYILAFLLAIFVSIAVHYKRTIIGAILFLVANTLVSVSKLLCVIGLVLSAIKFALIFI